MSLENVNQWTIEDVILDDAPPSANILNERGHLVAAMMEPQMARAILAALRQLQPYREYADAWFRIAQAEYDRAERIARERDELRERLSIAIQERDEARTERDEAGREARRWRGLLKYVSGHLLDMQDDSDRGQQLARLRHDIDYWLDKEEP